MFSREQYWLIANTLKLIPNDQTKYDVILKLSDMFSRHDPKFRPERFLDVSEDYKQSD